MADKRTITPEEKALLQAKHRQEEAEARNRKKERDARTHRLVQQFWFKSGLLSRIFFASFKLAEALS